MSDDTRARIRAERVEERRIEGVLAELGAEFVYLDARIGDVAGTDERIARVRAFFEAVPNVRDGRPYEWANRGECLHGLTRNENGNYRKGLQWYPSERGRTCPLVDQTNKALSEVGVLGIYDHMTYLRIADGRRVWLTQPYMETPQDVASNVEEAFRTGSDGALGAIVLGSDASWWNPPTTTLIAIAEPPAIEIIASAMRK